MNNLIMPIWAKKGPHGKREWVHNGRDASIIDTGDFPIHTPVGAIGFIAHEKSQQNINLRKVKMAEEMYKEFGTDDVKEQYALASDREVKK